MNEKECPYLLTCPFKDLIDVKSEDCWKFIYCYQDSLKSFGKCARYNFVIKKGEEPPKTLLPDGNIYIDNNLYSNNSENACPHMNNCPYIELTNYATEECWKIIYCYEESINGYESCARYNHMLNNENNMVQIILPDGRVFDHTK